MNYMIEYWKLSDYPGIFYLINFHLLQNAKQISIGAELKWKKIF